MRVKQNADGMEMYGFSLLLQADIDGSKAR